MSGRLRPETLHRVVSYGIGMLELVERLEHGRRPRRVIDQITGSGTAPGAMLFEANEALSRADFIKCLGMAAKELSETQYWLELCKGRRWVASDQAAYLSDETGQLLAVVKTIIARSRPKPRSS